MMLAHVATVEHIGMVSLALASVAFYLHTWTSNPHPRPGRAIGFCTGIGLVIVATAPPVEAIADASFTGHMAQHLLLYAVAPPLVVIGRPLTTVAPALNRTLMATISPLRHHPISVPIAAAVTTVVVLYGLHLTSLYDAAIANSAIHGATHIALIAAGILSWHVALRPGVADGPIRFGFAILMSVPIAILGLTLTTSTTPLSSHYTNLLGPAEAIRDQHAGGALMWVGAMVAGASLILTTIWRWASHEQLITERLEHVEHVEHVEASQFRQAVEREADRT